MKSSRLMLTVAAFLVFAVAAWAQGSREQQSTSNAQANSSGQTSAQSSSTVGNSSSAQSTSGTPASASGQSASEQGESGAANGANTTIRGCLTGGGGTYVLNSEDGSAYTLLGDGNALDKQINHEVEITGTKVAVPPSSQPDTHNTAAGAPGHPSGNNIQVSQMREISDHCAIPK